MPGSGHWGARPISAPLLLRQPAPQALPVPWFPLLRKEQAAEVICSPRQMLWYLLTKKDTSEADKHSHSYSAALEDEGALDTVTCAGRMHLRQNHISLQFSYKILVFIVSVF